MWLSKGEEGRGYFFNLRYWVIKKAQLKETIPNNVRANKIEFRQIKMMTFMRYFSHHF